MTDIIKFNETHIPKTEIGKMKFEIAEALNTITDLQNSHKNKELTAEQRYQLFNTSMRTVCDLLDIDLDMHEMMKTGSEGFSYSNTEDDTQALEKLLSDKQSHDIKTKLFTLFTLASGLSHSDTDIISIDDKGAEKPATQQELTKALRTNLVDLTESLGLSLDQVTESHAEQGKDTVKSIITDLQDMTFKAHELSAGDPEVFGSLVSEELDRILELLGMTELSITAEVKEKLPATTIKKELQDIYSLNDSMITGDPNHIPTYDDGTVIKQSDLADMNMNALDLIAEMLGFELEEGATQLVQPQADKPASEMTDQETYDSLPAEDKLNVDMLNKLHEVQDHILRSGQDAVSMNQVQTAISILEGSLGVMGKVEE